MANVFDVAERVLARYGSASAIKLQKLVYYAQAWHLVSAGRPLFDEPIIAYQYGPLCTPLWEQHRGQKMVRSGQFSHLAEGGLTDRAAEVVDAVLDTYGTMSMTALVDRTHSEAPWQTAQTSGGEITAEAMRLFYSLELSKGQLAPQIVVRSSSPVVEASDEPQLGPDDFSGFLRALAQER